MKKPRLIYYNDGHHFNAKRIEPPASVHMMQWPVDEVAGSSADLLVLGLGYGDVYFHDSKVGRVVGQMKEVWENYIDWRIMRMVEVGKEKGTDQLREVIGRGKELGIPVFPSLKMQHASVLGGQRCGLLKWEKGAEVCIGEEGKNEWAYDFANELVQESKLAMLREVLEDYGADGIELDFMFGDAYFKADEVEKNTPLMSEYIGEIRRLANEIGSAQGREVPVMVRVPLYREEGLRQGLDVEAWFEQGSVDWAVGQDPHAVTDSEPKPTWLPEAANAGGGAAYYRPPRRVYDERVGLPSIEMYRALGMTLQGQEWSGMYLGYMPWPFSEREFQILRELGFPQVYARHDKRYLLQPREGEMDGPTTTPQRKLPLELAEGRTESVGIWVADDLEGGREDGEMRKPILTLRFFFFCIEDDIEFRFNGRVLPWEEAEITDERALTIQVVLSGSMSVQAPLGASAHWFHYKLGLDEVKRGENTVEIEVKRLDARAGFARSLNGVEIQTRHRDFKRPEGLEREYIAPPGG